MKKSLKKNVYNPYLYNPDNTYLTITNELSDPDFSDQSSAHEQVQLQLQLEEKNKFSTFRKFIQSLPRWLYFQLEYYIIAVLIVSVLLILGLFLSAMAIWQVLR